jgi:hypothetical protein
VHKLHSDYVIEKLIVDLFIVMGYYRVNKIL